MFNPLSIVWDVDPVLFSIGSLEVRYYGLSWAMAIGFGLYLFTKFCRHEGLREELADSAFWYISLGTIIGARLGHCLFYDFDYYICHPLEILNTRQGGMASHGAALGMIVGLWLFARKNRMPYLWGLDRVAIAATIGGAFVRFGNLMNSEIYGEPTDLPWGFIFARNGETVAMHPTQIYEALCYLITFGVLILMYYRYDQGRKHPGILFGVGLIGIFVSRFVIEYIKNPQKSFELDMDLMMGQWLSIPFIILGATMVALSFTTKFRGYVPDLKLHAAPKNKKSKK